MKRALSALSISVIVVALTGALVVCASAGSLASRVGPAAHTAGVCKLGGQGEKLGPTYVTYVAVAGGASCPQAFKLVRSYYRCRIKHGGVKGRCGGVEGFRCTEHRFLVIAVQFNARVVCTRGRESIRHEYTQFT